MSGTARLRRGGPIWLAGRGRARQRFPSLTGRRETDVVIVGGGMTGALVALQFAEAGIGVHVVEAALAGRGSTAASSALLLQEPDHSRGELAHRYGWKTAVRIWHLSRSAVDDFMATIRRARVRCDMERRDAVYVAANSSAVDSLKRELE